ncbi:MAG: ABC transporter ATP-binding protein [Oscillochloris sp.]|nr:ABC transporter ATP-binding protein [Oscillochloris sp.]
MRISIRQYTALLREYLAPQRSRVAGLSILLLTSVGLQLIGPQLIRAFIDQAGAAAPPEDLARLALAFISLALLGQAVNLATTYLSEQVAWVATNRLRADLALHCLRLDMPFHKIYPAGAMIERVNGDVSALAGFFSHFVMRVIGSLLLLIGALSLLYREDWRVGLALTAFSLLALGVLITIRNLALPSMTAEREASANLYSLIEERLSALDDVRANSGAPHSMRRMHQAMGKLYRRELRAAMAGTSAWMSLMALFALGYGIALGVGAWLFQMGAVSLGVVYLCFQYTQMLRGPLEQLADQVNELQKAGAGIGRIGQLFTRSSAIRDVGTTPLPTGPLSVDLQGVGFAYEDEPASRGLGSALQAPSAELQPESRVLHNLTFALRPGEVLGLLGRTGSGKTTLTRLLFRLYEPSAGMIQLGEVGLRDTPLAELRRRVGIVTQDVQLFRASLRDNLSLFDPAISDEQIGVALEELGLGPWLRSLPAGLATEITGSEGLSAGEAQLLAFARVFLRDPGLVILDEASSRLDPATERLIERAVDRLLHNRTAIIIAHRLATVQRADTILILDNGVIAECGSRAELAHNEKSHFSRLLRVGMEEVLA